MKQRERGYAMSLEEVAAIMGISQQRVGQIERKALAKLRAEAAKRNFSFESMLIVSSITELQT